MTPITFTLLDSMPIEVIDRACDQAAEVADTFADFGDQRAWDALGSACCHLDSGDFVNGAILLAQAVRTINDLIEEVQS